MGELEEEDDEEGFEISEGFWLPLRLGLTYLSKTRVVSMGALRFQSASVVVMPNCWASLTTIVVSIVTGFILPWPN